MAADRAMKHGKERLALAVVDIGVVMLSIQLFFQRREIKRLIKSNLFYKILCVTDDDEAAFVVVQGAGDDWEVTEVYVVGWFVKDEQARFLQDESGKEHSSFLTFRESANWSGEGVAVEKKSCSCAADGFVVRLVHDFLKRGVRGFFEVQSREILFVIADLHAWCYDGFGIFSLGQASQERTFSNPIWASDQ